MFHYHCEIIGAYVIPFQRAMNNLGVQNLHHLENIHTFRWKSGVTAMLLLPFTATREKKLRILLPLSIASEEQQRKKAEEA